MQRDDCTESSFLYDINCGILIYTRNMERERYEKDIDDRNWGGRLLRNKQNTDLRQGLRRRIF